MKICKRRQSLGFDDTWLLIIGIPIVSLIMPFMIVQYNGADAHQPNWYRISVMITFIQACVCLLYTSPSPRDATLSRMPSSA